MKNADVVVHAGWSRVPSTAMLDPRADLRENVDLGLELMNAAGTAGIGKFVFLSSGGMVYGDPIRSPMDESHPTRPVSAYGASKLCFEQYLRTRAAYFGFERVVLRPSNVYGNEGGPTKPQGVIEHWLTRIGRGQALEVWNGLQIRRDYLHIDDLVDVMMRVLSAPVPEGTLNVGTGVGTSLAELVELMRDVTGSNIRVEHKGTMGQGSPANVLDPQRCMDRLDWRPVVDLRSGLERLWPVLLERCSGK
jgi:UDP-glucose 4-epimerase